MTVFAIIATRPSDKLEANINAKFPNDCRKLSENAWLVSASGTAQEMSGALDINGGKSDASAIVLSTAGYFGWASTDIWEWIKAKLEQSGG